MKLLFACLLVTASLPAQNVFAGKTVTAKYNQLDLSGQGVDYLQLWVSSTVAPSSKEFDVQVTALYVDSAGVPQATSLIIPRSNLGSAYPTNLPFNGPIQKLDRVIFQPVPPADVLVL